MVGRPPTDHLFTVQLVHDYQIGVKHEKCAIVLRMLQGAGVTGESLWSVTYEADTLVFKFLFKECDVIKWVKLCVC